MISKQLKYLLSVHSISVVKLSKETGLNAKTIYNYLDGRSPRNFSHIKMLCDYFKVSSDYLLFGQNSLHIQKEKIGFPLGNFKVFLQPIDK
jgi:transcriptional regulator with XRE-family HTH domain